MDTKDFYQQLADQNNISRDDAKVAVFAQVYSMGGTRTGRLRSSNIFGEPCRKCNVGENVHMTNGKSSLISGALKKCKEFVPSDNLRYCVWLHDKKKR